MRIKLDENLPEALVPILAGRGHDADTVRREGLGGQPDAPIWEAAQREGGFLNTQDLDFSDARRYRPGTHAGLLILRLHHPSRRRLIDRVRALYETEPVETWLRCFVVATEQKVRVRRPS